MCAMMQKFRMCWRSIPVPEQKERAHLSCARTVRPCRVPDYRASQRLHRTAEMACFVPMASRARPYLAAPPLAAFGKGGLWHNRKEDGLNPRKSLGERTRFYGREPELVPAAPGASAALHGEGGRGISHQSG